MTKLQGAGPLPGWTPMYADLSDFQGAFQEANYRVRPITDLFVEYFASDLKMACWRIDVNHDFRTDDGRSWTEILFLPVNGRLTKLLLPRHEAGRTTGQVSLYGQSDTAPPDKEMQDIMKMVTVFFKHALRDFYSQRR